MSLAGLRADVFDRAAGRCEWPECPAPPAELAHLRHRGMGGSPSANTADNCAALCHYHHALLDGRTTASRRYEVAVLLGAYLKGLPIGSH